MSEGGDHKNRVREYFDEDAARYASQRYGADYRDCHQYSYITRKRHVMKLLNIEGGRILDLGCGSGTYTRELLDRSFTIWGVDFSSRMIEMARSTFEEEVRSGLVTFQVGDVVGMDFDENFFDAAICIGVISYIPDLSAFLSNLVRVVKPDGIVIFQFSRRYSPKAIHELLVLPVLGRLKRFVGEGGGDSGWDFPLFRYAIESFNSLCSEHHFALEAGIHFDYTFP
ncbi:MAG: class I SAM-dependent methyltransferase, partial [Candidatus Krumholzibacteria bacterium]|nr:class I SAM-dependent methyltransferase [Candidatus Krumholzibacteria bacterium]